VLNELFVLFQPRRFLYSEFKLIRIGRGHERLLVRMKRVTAGGKDEGVTISEG
jgi:hypothetical protein